ncbi:hypothetical protein [Dactylosporangium sp. NPDC005555]|uniref:hypothetical protein n=1 Tax=Dactylosporangium sp. NPDC005555 TaxID=3154889 RepID=UPI0033B45B9A
MPGTVDQGGLFLVDAYVTFVIDRIQYWHHQRVSCASTTGDEGSPESGVAICPTAFCRRTGVGEEQVRGWMLAKSGEELVHGSASRAGRADPAIAYQAGEGLRIDTALSGKPKDLVAAGLDRCDEGAR